MKNILTIESFARNYKQAVVKEFNDSFFSTRDLTDEYKVAKIKILNRPKKELLFISDSIMDIDNTLKVFDTIDGAFCDVGRTVADFIYSENMPIEDLLHFMRKAMEDETFVYVSLKEVLFNELIKVADDNHLNFFFTNPDGQILFYEHNCKDQNFFNILEDSSLFENFKGDRLYSGLSFVREQTKLEFETSVDKLHASVKDLIKQASKDEDVNNLDANIPVIINTLEMSSIYDYTHIYQTLAKTSGGAVACAADNFDYVVFVDGYETCICTIITDEENANGKVGRVFQMRENDFEEILFMDNRRELFGATVKQIGSWI